MTRRIGRRLPSHLNHWRPTLARLEDRTVPSGTLYTPPTNFLFDQGYVARGVNPTQPLAIALSYLNEHAAAFGATPADLVDPVITSQYTDADTGITHLYLRQRVLGLEVVNADLNVAIQADGTLFSAAGGFVANLKTKLEAAPPTNTISPEEAVRRAAVSLGLNGKDEPVIVNPVVGPVQTYLISAPAISTVNIPAKFHYVPVEDGSAVLAWQLNIQTTDSQHWYDLSVDATTGAIVALADWMSDATYNVLDLPHESPVDGAFVLVTNPHDSTASPFAWHDTNGVAGPEFTDTRGNNVDAHLDRNADNTPDSTPRPDGGAALDFSQYRMNPTLQPAASANQNAAVVNLFYTNNMSHDIHYQYGFTEAAGNFQVNNYGKGGAGNDAVQADAQDGSGTNNANFGTPTDGNAPRMQMYEWTSTNPRTDSDLDNGVIIHEYGHGVSNRLTGGPGNSSALNNIQSGGMGEGWSDFFAIMFQQRPTDTPATGIGMGTYLRGQPITGLGIRAYRYSYDMTINPMMWDSYGTSGTTPYGLAKSTEVHRTGTIWATTLWDLNWLLINKYGYDPNLMTGWSATPGPGHAGNKLTLKLVMDAMKLQPANPSFIDARNAILSADIALTGGANVFEIWSAFARRGLGVSATTASSSSTTLTTATDMPMLVAGFTPAANSIVSAKPTSYVVSVSDPITPGTLDAADLKINGNPATGVAYTPGASNATFTFAVDPISTEGIQTVAIAAGAFTRASDGSGVLAGISTFTFDATPLTITSTVPAPGAIVEPGLTKLTVNLSQAVNPASVQTTDLSITRGSVTGFNLLNSDTTIEFILSDINNEGSLYFNVAAGALADTAVSMNAAFAGAYTLDYGVIPYPTPLMARQPLGSLVYDNTHYFGVIGPAGDSDSYTLNLDAGQTLSVIMTPDSALRPSLTITGPGTNQTKSATVPGAIAQLTLVPIATAGTYTLAVSGIAGTTGGFSLGVVINSGNESEAGGASTNDTIGGAESLATSFVNLGAGVSRASISGRTELPAAAINAEVEPNDATFDATNATKFYAPPNSIYQLGISGTLSSGSDADYFNIGALQVGDVLTISEAGLDSGRGTSDDPFVRLYRAGQVAVLTSDDDSGTGTDSLIYRYTITVADTYYVRAYRFGSTDIGDYDLGIWLENSGAAPATGATFTNEVEPNETTGGANNASSAWRTLPYYSTVAGVIGGGDTDLFAYQFAAGDVVTIVADSTSTLIPSAALLDAGGSILATDSGGSAVGGASGLSTIYGYVIPSAGTYFLRMTGASSTTGSYTADVYLSTTSVLPTVPLGRDLFSFTLAAGQSASAIVNAALAGAADIAILDSLGAVVGSSTGGSSNVDRIVSNFTALTAGTYYVQVNGAKDIDYQLTVVTGGTFDAEANDTFATAQPLGAGRATLGAISGNDDWYQLTLAAGDTVTLTTATPGDGAGEFGNTLNPLIELFTPANVSMGSDDNSAADGRNAILTKVISTPGSYRIRVTGSAGSNGEYVLVAKLNDTPAAKVNTVVIGDGSAQRSRVTSLTVTFDQNVTLPANPADAFQLVRQSDSAAVALSASQAGGSVTLTFTGGAVDADSLADGRYTLTILAAQVNAGNFDGDGNGTAGDNYVLASAATPNPPTNVWRLFGDSDGDNDVDTTDFGAFRGVFGGSSALFDFDNDGDVDTSDFGAFRARFGSSV